VARLLEDQGEVGPAWGPVAKRVCVVAVDQAGATLVSARDDRLRRAVEAALG